MKFRDINRWHLALAAFLAAPIGFLIWEQLMRQCAISRGAQI
jgi:hypothetical protein